MIAKEFRTFEAIKHPELDDSISYDEADDMCRRHCESYTADDVREVVELYAEMRDESRFWPIWKKAFDGVSG